MNAIELSVFASRLAAICEEMGALLKCAAFSPNIKDRLDFSCALFDRRGSWRPRRPISRCTWGVWPTLWRIL